MTLVTAAESDLSKWQCQNLFLLSTGHFSFFLSVVQSIFFFERMLPTRAEININFTRAACKYVKPYLFYNAPFRRNSQPSVFEGDHKNRGDYRVLVVVATVLESSSLRVQDIDRTVVPFHNNRNLWFKPLNPNILLAPIDELIPWDSILLQLHFLFRQSESLSTNLAPENITITRRLLPLDRSQDSTGPLQISDFRS